MQGIGGSLLHLASGDPFADWEEGPGWREEAARKGVGLNLLDYLTHDIHATVEKLRAGGVRFQDTPDTYYEAVDARIPGHGESIDRLRANRVLIDGDGEQEGIFLQIFTDTMVGPIFFEIIQRKGNEGFGRSSRRAPPPIRPLKDRFVSPAARRALRIGCERG